MSKTFKIVLILLVVASLASALLAVFAFVGKEREYMKRLLVEDKLAATLKEKKTLEKEIEDSKNTIEEKEARISAMDMEVRKLLSEVEEEKNKNKSILTDLGAKKKEVGDLKENLERERKEKLTISSKLEELELDYEKAKKDITRLKNEKLKLEKDLSELKGRSVNLDTIVVKPQEPAKDLLRGSVLVVNRDYNFVVTDLGEEEGVKKGMVFEMRDGKSVLGKAEIDKVYDTMSSATILPGANIDYIKKGNLVIESR